jgi:hypothetical protein
MKKLLYLGILLILGSCGSNVESTTTIVYMDGREVSTIKIDNLEVTEDLGGMDWDKALTLAMSQVTK